VNVANLTFTWPDGPPAQPDNVLADGQATMVTGQGSQLGFLAASNNAPLSGSGTVYYTDGTVQAIVLPKITGTVAGYQAAMHIFAISP
jgi:hypothetical protein